MLLLQGGRLQCCLWGCLQGYTAAGAESGANLLLGLWPPTGMLPFDALMILLPRCPALAPLHPRRSDNGGASFLGEVVTAVKEMVETKQWALDSIPRVHEPFLQTLATGQGSDLPSVAALPVAPVAVPEGAPASLVGALVLEAFPPRGVIHFLEKQHTQVGVAVGFGGLGWATSAVQRPGTAMCGEVLQRLTAAPDCPTHPPTHPQAGRSPPR